MIKKSFFIFAISFFLLGYSKNTIFSADFIHYQKDGQKPEIILTGEIRKGDSEKLDKILEQYNDYSGGNYVNSNRGNVRLNSPGGDYLEGLEMGYMIHRYGWSTTVDSTSMCLSACALAFLGGTNRPGEYNWTPDRNLGVGGKLGFHPFYTLTDQVVKLSTGIDMGRFATNILYGYASLLKIKPDFFVEMLKLNPKDMYFITKPKDFETLGISVFSEKQGVLNDFYIDRTKAINIARWAVNNMDVHDWDRDIWNSRITVEEFSNNDFIKYTLETIKDDEYETNLLIKRIKKIIDIYKDKNDTEQYSLLSELKFLPTINDNTTIYKINGFMNTHYNKSVMCFIIVNNNGKNNMQYSYVIMPIEEFKGPLYKTETFNGEKFVPMMHGSEKNIWVINSL